MGINSENIQALERVFRKPSLRDYYEAGREAVELIEERGYGKKKETVRELSQHLGLGNRILWDVMRFYRSFNKDMVVRAESMGANWTGIRRFMTQVDDPKTAGLTRLQAMVGP